MAKKAISQQSTFTPDSPYEIRVQAKSCILSITRTNLEFDPSINRVGGIVGTGANDGFLKTVAF
jgi:hypothetical protein